MSISRRLSCPSLPRSRRLLAMCVGSRVQRLWGSILVIPSLESTWFIEAKPGAWLVRPLSQWAKCSWMLRLVLFKVLVVKGMDNT